MSKTIDGTLFLISAGDLERIESYLSSQGMTFDTGLEDHRFFIEVKEYPEILTKLEAAELHPETKAWKILSISNSGVTLYFAYPSGDGYVFIPQNNIVAIHTFGDEQLSNIQKRNSDKTD